TDPHKCLDDNEVLSQMATIILAGHETTASTMTWMLYELARHPEDQRRVREEIQDLRKRKREARQDEEFNSNDYDSMKFFNVVIKETLRLYPIVITLFRYTDRDDVIPLEEPVVSASGEKLKEIPVGKGQRVHINIMGYNKSKSIWGPDAHMWNPERFLNVKKGSTLGVYANLLTFSEL
ncbi:cytochrome P450, partial [Dendrothele bispora CBS 962.96]